MTLQAVPLAIAECRDIGAERALATRERLPVIGEIGEVHSYINDRWSISMRPTSVHICAIAPGA